MDHPVGSPHLGERGLLSNLKSINSQEGIKSSRKWHEIGANDTFVWDCSLMKNYSPVTKYFAEIFEGRSRIHGQGKVHFVIWSRKVSISAKQAPNFNQKIVSVASIMHFLRIIFELRDGFDGFILLE